jgi:hypothetical protein
VQRACAAAAEHGDVRLVVPLPGQRIDVLAPPALADWWSAVGSGGDRPAGEADRPAPITSRD